MSKKVFLVQEPDQSEEWFPFEAYDASGAAVDYAEDADSNSGGEFTDGAEVLVKEGPDGVPQKYTMGVNYEKYFMAFPRIESATT